MAESGPRAGLQNSGSRMFMLRVKTLSVRDCNWRNPRKKNYRECSNIKSECVTALTGSVPRKMAATLQKDSAPCGNQTHVARLSTTSLNHSTIGSYRSLEKNGIWLFILLELFCTAFFGCRIVDLRKLRLNIKARQAIPEFLNTNLWSIHFITLYIDWSWNFFIHFFFHSWRL